MKTIFGIFAKKIKTTIFLQIHNSQLQYRVDLGSGENVLVIKQATVTDYQWHTVKVTRRAKQLSLTLNERHRVNKTTSGAGVVLNSRRDHLYFSAEIDDTDIKRKNQRLTKSANFVGCLKNAELNGYR